MLAGEPEPEPEPTSAGHALDELMQRDEDALVRRLHADRLRRGSTVAGSSGDDRRNPDAAVGSGRPGAAEMHLESEAHKSPREQTQRHGVAVHREL